MLYLNRCLDIRLDLVQSMLNRNTFCEEKVVGYIDTFVQNHVSVLKRNILYYLSDSEINIVSTNACILNGLITAIQES